MTLFDKSDAPAKTIIALTDGNDTKSQVPPLKPLALRTNVAFTFIQSPLAIERPLAKRNSMLIFFGFFCTHWG